MRFDVMQEMKSCVPSERIKPRYRLGLISSFSAVFPIAAAFTLFYRFPIPFTGYVCGEDQVLRSQFAVLFYGVGCSGFVIVGLFSVVVSWVLSICNIRESLQTSVTIFCGCIVAFLCAGVLTILDKIIGPW